MKLPIWSSETKGRRASVLAGLIVVHALCAPYFIEGVRGGRRTEAPHHSLEAVAVVALVCGVIFLMIELYSLLSRMSHMETARGPLAEVIDAFFDNLRLTGAKWDVDTIILKGLDNASVTRPRQTALGAVRAHSANIHARFGRDGRTQVISVFMDKLMAKAIDTDGVTGKRPGGHLVPPSSRQQT